MNTDTHGSTAGGFARPMGPRRRAWERLKYRYDRIAFEERQLRTDVASANENNPNLAGNPIVLPPRPPLPELPPMPEWEE